MSNGEMLRSLQLIIDGDEPLPPRVSNSMILAAVIETYKSQSEMDTKLEGVSSAQVVLSGRVDNNHEEIGRLRSRSNVLDGLVAFGTLLVTGLLAALKK